MNDFKGWIIDLFAFFITYDEKRLANGEEYKGFFFGGVNYLVTSKYRLTIRRKTIENTENEEFRTVSSQSVSHSFDYDASDPEGEEKRTIVGYITEEDYEYIEGGGYLNAGGYASTIDVLEFLIYVPVIVEDGLIDAQLNSIVIDFPIYQITTGNLMYVALIFTLDNGYNVNTKI